MRLLNAEQMRELDRRAIEDIGIPGLVLMENAGRAAAEQLVRRFAGLFPGPVLVLAGKGNNGGDGLVIARHLENAGWSVRTILLAGKDQVSGDAAVNLKILLNSGGQVVFATAGEALGRELEANGGCRLVVDALFGTGLSSELCGIARMAVDWINASGKPVLAVDIPSGVDASSGAVLGTAVRAQLTVTFACAKLGHLVYPGADCVGRLEVVDIGIPAKLAGQSPCLASLETPASAAGLLPARPGNGHKGTFGHLLVVAGSRGKTGAAALAAEAGLRGGTGLVTLAAPASLQPLLAGKLTEVMTEPLAEVDGALSLQALDEVQLLASGKQSLALGPGLGTARETVALVRRLVTELPQPLVLDADALNALAEGPEVLRQRSGPHPVLTPHPGEMARLAGTRVAEVEKDRVGQARAFAQKFQAVVVLKGARTVTASPDGTVYLNPTGNPGLGSGGMGDVLTGLIGALLAQGLDPFAAARLGVYWHGLAADRLAEKMGMAGLLAGDLLKELPATRRALQNSEDEHVEG